MQPNGAQLARQLARPLLSELWPFSWDQTVSSVLVPWRIADIGDELQGGRTMQKQLLRRAFEIRPH